MSDKPVDPMDDFAASIDAAVDQIQEQMAKTGRELSYLENCSPASRSSSTAIRAASAGCPA